MYFLGPKLKKNIRGEKIERQRETEREQGRMGVKS